MSLPSRMPDALEAVRTSPTERDTHLPIFCRN